MSQTVNRIMKRVRSFYRGPDFWPICLFFLLTLAIMWPLLGRGYILLTDMVITPHTHFNIPAIAAGEQLPNTISHTALFWMLTIGLPADIAQKVVLLGLVFGGLVLSYVAFKPFTRLARISSAVLYMLNPFTYDRFMAGHWAFLVGYALLPMFITQLIRLLTRPRESSIKRPVLLWTVAALFSPHYLLLYGIVLFALAVAHVRTKRQLRNVLQIPALVMLLSSWWIIWAVAAAPNGITSASALDFQSAATGSNSLLMTLLGFQGFWLQSWDTIQDYISWWPILIFVLLVVAAVGIVRYSYKNNTKYLTALSALCMVGGSLIFASSLHPSTASINTWLYDTIPGLSLLREPQKILVLYIIWICFFLSVTVHWLRYVHKYAAYACAVVIISSSITLSAPWWFGARGQIELVQYPASWQTINEELQADETILTLPWSLYISNSFAGTLTAHPASTYFGEKAISSSNPGLPNTPDTTRPLYTDAHQAIDSEDPLLLSRALGDLNTTYVIIVESSSSDQYDWLESSSSFRLDPLTESGSTVLKLVDK